MTVRITRAMAMAAALGGTVALAACAGGAPDLPQATVLSPEGSNHQNVVFAPDGRQVAFWSVSADGRDLVVARADLSEPRNLARSTLQFTDPVWSPDGATLTWGTSGTGLINIWIAPADGSAAARQLTTGGGVEVPFYFYPDGRRLVYGRTDQGGVIELGVLDVETGTSARLPVPDSSGLWLASPSPDGSHMAYQRLIGGLTTLWVADSSGGNLRPLTTEGFENTPGPNFWSPDSRALVFVSTRTGTGDVYVLPVDGGAPRQLTRDVRNDYGPRWSPDGRWVAFLSQRGRQTDVWLVAADGGSELRVTDDEIVEGNLQWIPGSTQLAFTRPDLERALWVVSVADGTERRLTPDSIRVGDFDLSPDRTQMVYQIVRGGGVADLAVIAVAGGESRTIVSGGAQNWYPRWSPDGSQIAFVSNRAGNDDAWVVDAMGGEPRRITDWPTNESAVEWTADGTGFYVLSPRDADPIQDVWRVNVDGSEPRRLTTVGTVDGIMTSPLVPDLFLTTIGGREGRFVLQRLLPDGRLEVLWDRTNVADLWSRGVSPSGDAIVIDAMSEQGNPTSILIPLTGGPGRQLIGENEFSSDWSADGSQLLVGRPAGAADIGVRSLADSSTRMLTQNSDPEGSPRWSADGEHVIFVRSTPREQIVTVDVGKLIGR